MNLLDVSNKTFLTTGASRGIGFGIAKQLAQAGAISYGTARKTDDFAAMEQAGIKPLQADVTDAASIKAAVEKVRADHERLDCLVNNAGVAADLPASAIKPELTDKLIDTNFKGVFYACQAYHKAQRKQGGIIINVASVLGLRGFPLSSVYCGTKGAVVQLTKSLASEWTASGWRINTICPGFIDTDMTEMIKRKEEYTKAMEAKIPMRRIGKVEDIAGAVVFLASDAAAYMTGSELVIDGGINAVLG